MFFFFFFFFFFLIKNHYIYLVYTLYIPVKPVEITHNACLCSNTQHGTNSIHSLTVSLVDWPTAYNDSTYSERTNRGPIDLSANHLAAFCQLSDVVALISALLKHGYIVWYRSI